MDTIILRQLDGSASPDEKQMLLQWLKASEANRTAYLEIRNLWLSCDAAPCDDEEMYRALNRLRCRLSDKRTLAAKKRPLQHGRYVAAAVAILLLSLGCHLLIHLYNVPQEEVMLRNRLITSQGSKGHFVLPDGSVVRLNAESTLTYPDTFDGAERKVYLEGEGYFEVAENREQPFIVRSGDLAVEALGTVFDICGYTFQHKTEVVLLEGSVKVTSPAFGKDIFLSPDQMLEVTDDGVMHIREPNARLHTSWIQSKLVFDKARLSDIILSLESWYRMEIVCPPAFAEKTLMSFTVGSAENIQDLLKAMSLVIPVTWSVADNVATITPLQ